MGKQQIKGITIEIGGETKELNSALKEIGKESKSIQNELKAVEKALKLDPENTELLAQKQELLQKALEASRQKMEALTAAQEQMTRAHANQPAWEAAYQPLQQAMEQTQAKLKDLMKEDEKLKAQLSSGEISESEYADFRQTLEETQEEAKQLKQQMRALDEEFADGHISDEEYRQFQRELSAATQEADQLEQTVRRNYSTLGKFANAAKEAGDSVNKEADKFAPLSAAAAGVAAGAVAVVQETKELRGDLGRLETNAERAGISLDTIHGCMKKLSAISDETDSHVEALSNLMMTGFSENQMVVALDAIAGAYVRFPDTMKVESLADSIQETIATGAATGQFAELLDRLGVGADNFSEKMGEMSQQGLSLDYVVNYLAHSGLSKSYEAFVQNNEALVESNQSSSQLQQTMADLGNALQPLINDLLIPLIDIITRAVDWFSNLNDGQKKLISTAVLVVAAITPILKTISTVFNTIGNVSFGMNALGRASRGFASGAGNAAYLTFVKWAAIIGAVVLAVTALIAMINILIGKGNEVNSTMANVNGMVSSAAGGMSGRVQAYADGTDYHPGGWALVGEQGAELLQLPRGARVYTHDQTRQMLNAPQSNAGGDTFQINVNVQSLEDVQQLIKIAKDARRMQRMGTVMA